MADRSVGVCHHAGTRSFASRHALPVGQGVPPGPGVKVGSFAGSVKEQVARKAISWLTEHPPEWISKISVIEGNKTRRRFWQPGGGYDRNVEQLGTLQSIIDYIHANPVRRGFVERPQDWEWSSARWYAGMLPVPIEMDRTLPTFLK